MAEIIDIQKENQIFISLAIKCKLITSNQEQQIVSKLIEKYQLDNKYSVVEIFKKNHFMSQEKIDFLLSIKRHLKIKLLDQKFGQLGVNNYFIKPKAVEKALYIQDQFFQKTRKSKKIGDILLENKEISLANKTAILLTQDRIQDHLLEQSMAELATSEIEKMNINMRFGAIAVKNEMISIKQLNQALKIQKSKLKSGQKVYLGEVFQNLFEMSEHEIMQILKIQKDLEKKRLSLETAVARYQSEIKNIKQLNELFELSVAKNKMKAYVHRVKDSPETIEVRHFKNWLRLNGIQFGVCSDEIILVFLDQSDRGAKLKIATGTFPTESRDEVVEFFFDTEANVNLENCRKEASQSVEKGDRLAMITPCQLGEHGKNVLGHPVAPSDPNTFSIAIGEGVYKKGNEFLADVDGFPILFKKRTLFVMPPAQTYSLENYTGDIKTDTAEKYKDVNLNLEGNIFETGIVNCHHLTATGNVFGTVHATGNIEVRGFTGSEIKKGKGSGTHLQANGDITIKKNIANAEIITSKSLIAPKSDLVSSTICAFQDIYLNNVYSGSTKPSVLQIGLESNVKIDTINSIIEKQNALLRKLQRLDQLNELTADFQQKINIQNEYLEKQNVLNYLLKVFNNADLAHIEHIEQKIQIFEVPLKGDLNTSQNSDSSLAYMDEVLSHIGNLSAEDQKNYVNEKLGMIADMYKATVNAIDRFSSEYKAKSKFIMKKVDKMQPEIDKVKQKIEALLIEKDYISLNESVYNPLNQSMIKIKNMMEKGTIIKGKKTSEIISENVYSVKVREIKDSATKNYKIIIEGYYE